MTAFTDFLYRQRSRLRYHTAKSEVKKNIAEINRHRPLIQTRGNSYYVPEVSLFMPKGLLDHLFVRFDLLVKIVKDLNGRYIWEDDKLFFTFDNLKLHISSVNELFIINEVFCDHCYNFRSSPGLRYNVIDIGMNVGLASLFFAEKEFVNSVFSFEPCREPFAHALVNIKVNQHLSAKIKAFNFGLGRGDREDKMFYSPFTSGTSGQFIESTGHGIHEIQPILIRDAFKTISEIINANSDFPYLLKIDCEGAEYEILDSLIGNGFPSQIQTIFMEWHGAASDDLVTKIASVGFEMVFTRVKSNLGLIYAFR